MFLDVVEFSVSVPIQVDSRGGRQEWMLRFLRFLALDGYCRRVGLLRGERKGMRGRRRRSLRRCGNRRRHYEVVKVHGVEVRSVGGAAANGLSQLRDAGRSLRLRVEWLAFLIGTGVC